jgi:hypothetical protein
MNIVRQSVRGLLEASPGYRALPPAHRRSLARDTEHVAAYLVDPHGLMAGEFQQPLLAGVVAALGAPAALLPDGIVPNAAASDARVAAVDFPGFVAGLIHGVFGAVVALSIEQMRAYADLVKAVSATVDAFARDGISDRSARAALLAEFPDVFCSATPQLARLQFRSQGDSAALARLALAIGLRDPVVDPKQAGEVARIVSAARRRIARNRQQQLATWVTMGIHRCAFGAGETST